MHVAIIGNGITGITAAQRIRKQRPDWKITVISGESKYHYSRPALMYIYMGHMRYQDTKPYPDEHWERQRIDLLRDWVTDIDVEGKALSMRKTGTLDFDKLLIATGSKSNKFGWPGQDLAGVQGLWSLMDLKQLYESSSTCQRAVIVGGGLIGIELAEMLHSRGIHVTFLVREKSYWNNVLPPEESAMVTREIQKAGFDLRLGVSMTEIEDDGTGRACAVHTDAGDRIECQIVGLTAGVSPNVDLVKDHGQIETGRGILVDWNLTTRTPDVYAAGDCAELVTEGEARNVIQQVWYSGKMQGEVVGDVIAGLDRKYDPGIWYNSAKFLDLEYQTYGRVNMRIPEEKNLYWEHPNGRQAIRLVYTDQKIEGINVMGTRYRHEVCESWLREERSVDYVLEHLSDANFDPEFFQLCDGRAAEAMRGQLA